MELWTDTYPGKAFNKATAPKTLSLSWDQFVDSLYVRGVIDQTVHQILQTTHETEVDSPGAVFDALLGAIDWARDDVSRIVQGQNAKAGVVPVYRSTVSIEFGPDQVRAVDVLTWIVRARASNNRRDFAAVYALTLDPGDAVRWVAYVTRIFEAVGCKVRSDVSERKWDETLAQRGALWSLQLNPEGMNLSDIDIDDLASFERVFNAVESHPKYVKS